MKSVHRSLLFGLAAIALLGALSVAVISWLPDAPRAAPEGQVTLPVPQPVPSATDPVVAEPPGGPAGAPSPGNAPGKPSAPPPRIQRPPHRLPRGSPAPVDLFRGLEALQQRISRCADDGSRSQGSSARQGPGSGGQTVLMLDLEALEGKVRIVDTLVQTRGTASERAISCAQATLLGEEIPVKASQPGSNIKMSFALRF